MNQHRRDLGGDDVALLVAIPYESVEKYSHGRVIKLHCSVNDCDTLPPEVCTLTSLQELRLSDCDYLTELPPQIQNLKGLKTLHLDRCASLTTLPPEIGDLANLEELDLCNCEFFTELPPQIHNLKRLRKLNLESGRSFITFPPEIGDLTNLEELRLHRCENLLSLPSEIGQLSNLRVLKLGLCESLTSLPPEIRNLSSLEDVYLPADIYLVEFIERGGMEGWTSLRRLCLTKNEGRLRLSDNEYLRIFRHLPSWLVGLRLRADIDSIDLLSRAQLPPRIRALGLQRWSFDMMSASESDKQSLVDGLIRNRYLGFICSNFHEMKLYSPLAEHYLDINESGRCLIEGDHPIPLSVWSVVLERVNQKLTRRDISIVRISENEARNLRRRANVIYYLLHGPALAAHQSLV